MSESTPKIEMSGQEETSDARKLAETLASSNRLPDKLMKILLANEAPDAIWWLPTRGDTFIINKSRFQDEILLKYFRGNKFKSLVRNMHRWGFKRLTSDVEPAGKTVAFSNPLFQKNQPELVLQIKMVNHAKERKMAQINLAMKVPAEKSPVPVSHTAQVAAKPGAVCPNSVTAKLLENTTDAPLEQPPRAFEAAPNAADLARLLGNQGLTTLSQQTGLLRDSAALLGASNCPGAGNSNVLRFLSQGLPRRDPIMESFLRRRGPNGGLIPSTGGGLLANSFRQPILGLGFVGQVGAGRPRNLVLGSTANLRQIDFLMNSIGHPGQNHVEAGNGALGLARKN